MDSKTSQTQLSADLEKILKSGTTNEQGWFAVQTLLVRGTTEGTIDETISGFLDQVDESSYSLSDWLEALLRFDEWMNEKGQNVRPLDSMIGYIHCCTMTTPETLSPPGLDRLVEKNLDEWGFDAGQAVSVGED